MVKGGDVEGEGEGEGIQTPLHTHLQHIGQDEPEGEEVGEIKLHNRWRGRKGLAVGLDRWVTQFKTLMWKNSLILKRRTFTLAIIILLPLAAVGVFAIHTGISSTSDSSFSFSPVAVKGLGACDAFHSDSCVLAVYGPSTSETDSIMQIFASNNGKTMGTDVLGFSTIEEAQNRVLTHLGTVEYTIIWNVSEASKIPSYELFYNSTRQDTTRSTSTGIDFDLLVMQKEIEHAALEFLSSSTVYNMSYGVFGEEDPRTGTSTNGTTTHCDLQKYDFSNLETAAPFVFVFAFTLIGFVATNVMAEERTDRLLTSLRRLGCYDSAYVLSWFFSFQVPAFVGCSLAAIVASGVDFHFFKKIDVGIFFLLMWLFVSAMLANACFLSSLVRSQSTITALVFTTFLIVVITVATCEGPTLNSYSYTVLDSGSEECYWTASKSNRVFSSELTANKFVIFLVFFMPWFYATKALTDMMSVVQYQGQTLSLSDLGTQTLYYSGKTFRSEWIGYAFWILFAQTICFLFLAWFCGLLLSSDSGEGRDLLSVLVPRYLRELLFGKTEAIVLEGDIRGIERAKSAADQSIRLYKVSKTYKGTQALKEVSVEIKHGEIFCLLGHNGAGKSTLINTMTGVILPTHGEIYIRGVDAKQDIQDVQQTLGVCPQDDLLWNDLTAQEHLILHAMFKGINPGPPLTGAVKDILKRVQLLQRANSMARFFSGGMKRRLSVAMSVIGDVNIVILDEPSTGLDVINRRHVWDMVMWMKKNRIIILTTHNMEEADYLGDQICFLHGGRVRAIGDSLFLKEQYGHGYQVNLVSHPYYVPALRHAVSKILPGTEFVGGQELETGYIQCSINKRLVNLLPRLFAWLEKSPQASQTIREWGISNTTLEQVFLRLCVQNNAVNFSDNDLSMVLDRMCVLCRQQPKERVMLQTIAGIQFFLDDAICSVCATTPPTTLQLHDGPNGNVETKSHLQLEDVNDIIIIPELDAVLKPLLEAQAQAASNNSSTPTIEIPQSLATPLMATKTHIHALGIHRFLLAQIKATVRKNWILQKRQYCSNICTVIFILIIVVLLYVLGSLFAVTNYLEVCSQGNIVLKTAGCSVDSVRSTVFGTNARSCIGGCYVGDAYSYYAPVIWSGASIIPQYAGISSGCSAESDKTCNSVFYFAKSPTTFDDANSVDLYQLNNQLDVYNEVLKTQQEDGYHYTTCYKYYDTVYSKNFSSAYTYFSSLFAHAAFYCPTCKNDSILSPSYFNGTVWSSYESPSAYPFGFVNFATADNSLLGNGCPPLEAEISVASLYSTKDKTYVAMSYTNILSNTLIPLPNSTIAAYLSEYGYLDFNWAGVQSGTAFLLTILTMLVLNSLWPLAVWRLAYERNANLLTQMKTIGVHISAYMLGMLVFDLAQFYILGLALMGFLKGAKIERFDNSPFGILFGIVIFSGYALNASSMIFVRLFGKARFGSLLAAILCVGMAVGSSLLHVLLYSQQGSWPNALSLIPFFAQSRALYIVLVYQTMTSEISYAFGLMFVTGTLCFVAGYILDADINWVDLQKRLYLCAFSQRTATIVDVEIGEKTSVSNDPAVVEEYAVVGTANPLEFQILVRNLWKAFESQVAVRNLSLGLRAGECFGFLGPNGAGKSTTISILSGLIEPTVGQVFIAGMDIRTSKVAVHKYVGICPQFDIVWDELTVQEHIAYQARVRGFVGRSVYAETQRVASAVELDGDAYNTRAKQLSGGMRRRLSIGMAIVGNPPILLMDEPSTGLDPETRQHVWRIIHKLKTPERLILLTTHSMEEAENLCTRIGIIALGTLQCIGSTHQLKKQYGKGYTLSVNMMQPLPSGFLERIMADDVPYNEDESPAYRLHSLVTQQLEPGATVMTASNKSVKYSLSKVSIARVFQLMENNKARLSIREWGLAVTSLEEVFVNAVKAAGDV